jgi:hypothetical protein
MCHNKGDCNKLIKKVVPYSDWIRCANENGYFKKVFEGEDEKLGICLK